MLQTTNNGKQLFVVHRVVTLGGDVLFREEGNWTQDAVVVLLR
jgi:hypothetical protein